MKQPKALKIFFLTEMWERYAFYTIQAMLVLYLTQRFRFSDSHAYNLLGQFTALVYILPVLGGWVADRYLGQRFSVLIGGFFMCVGYALLALNRESLFWGLSLAALGNGLFKPNISTLLGQFYEKNDSRRDAGFTLFYIGINLGSMLTYFSSGYIKEAFGWLVCFGAASFALFIGIIVFRLGYRYFEDKGLPLHERGTLSHFLKKHRWIFVGFVAAVLVVYFSMTFVVVSSYGLYVFGVGFCVYAMATSWKHGPVARRKVLGLLLLYLLSIAFWALYFQKFFSVNLFTERAIDRVIMGHQIPSSVFFSLTGIFMLTLGSGFAALWQSGKVKLSTPTKFCLGILFLALSMQVLVWIIAYASPINGASGPSAGWLALFYFCLVLGELLLSPIGLAMVTEYSPPENVSLMMGGWFMTTGFGGKVAGVLAKYASVPSGITDQHQLQAIYQQAFQHCAWFGLAIFLISLAFIPVIKKLLGQAKD